MPVTVTDTDEAAAWGAALCAGAAVGLFASPLADPRDLAGAQPIAPDPARSAAYETRYRLHCRIAETHGPALAARSTPSPEAGRVTDYDVVILGAGINGAGLFRDLCEQGVRCLIVDKADFGSGTSAAPSRLIHGGLKYLETGEFGLVAQSTLERNLLLRNAPHCVDAAPHRHPDLLLDHAASAPRCAPCSARRPPRAAAARCSSRSASRSTTSTAPAHRVMPRHRLVGRRRALADMPPLTPAIVAAGTYYDAKVSRPERLVSSWSQDGLAASPGSAALNYTHA